MQVPARGPPNLAGQANDGALAFLSLKPCYHPRNMSVSPISGTTLHGSLCLLGFQELHASLCLTILTVKSVAAGVHSLVQGVQPEQGSEAAAQVLLRASLLNHLLSKNQIQLGCSAHTMPCRSRQKHYQVQLSADCFCRVILLRTRKTITQSILRHVKLHAMSPESCDPPATEPACQTPASRDKRVDAAVETCRNMKKRRVDGVCACLLFRRWQTILSGATWWPWTSHSPTHTWATAATHRMSWGRSWTRWFLLLPCIALKLVSSSSFPPGRFIRYRNSHAACRH